MNWQKRNKSEREPVECRQFLRTLIFERLKFLFGVINKNRIVGNWTIDSLFLQIRDTAVKWRDN